MLQIEVPRLQFRKSRSDLAIKNSTKDGVNFLRKSSISTNCLLIGIHSLRFNYLLTVKIHLLIRIGFAPDNPYNTIGLLKWSFGTGTYHYIDAASKKPYIYYPIIKWSPGSRYLSYLRGGNAFGDYNGDAYQLNVCDLETYQDRQVMANAGLEWSWTYHGSILCSPIKPEQASDVALRLARPSVYEADVAAGAPRKLFDGGYFAHESPDGKWVAFCDWPGKLLEDGASKEVENNSQRGLFLFYKPTGKRVFVGELKLAEGSVPILQWSTDSQSLYVLEQNGAQQSTTATLSRMDMEQQQLRPLATLSIERGEGVDHGLAGIFQSRGIAADNRYLYFDAVQIISGPQGYVNTLRTLIAVDTQTGKQTPIARLKNIANANPDWDWHDDSGVNPAFVAAQKIENVLPSINAATAPRS